MNVAVDQRRTTPARFRDPSWIRAALAGALLIGGAQTQAQDTGSKAAAPSQSAPAPKAGAATKAAPSADPKSQASYSIGLSMGEQLHAAGMSSDTLSVDRIAQGIRDALTGKAKMTEADQLAKALGEPEKP